MHWSVTQRTLIQSDSPPQIYVIDSADENRVQETGIELKSLLSDQSLAGIPVLIFANKADLDLALTPEELTEMLQLHNIRDRQWMIQKCSAKTGDGLEDGIKWVIKTCRCLLGCDPTFSLVFKQVKLVRRHHRCPLHRHHSVFRFWQTLRAVLIRRRQPSPNLLMCIVCVCVCVAFKTFR